MMYAKKSECRMAAETLTTPRKSQKSMWMDVIIRDFFPKLSFTIF